MLPLQTFGILVILGINKLCRTPKCSRRDTKGFVLVSDCEGKCSDVFGFFYVCRKNTVGDGLGGGG